MSAADKPVGLNRRAGVGMKAAAVMNVTMGQCKFQVSHCTSQDSPLLSGVGLGFVRGRFKR
jgi:hypothetical protein